LDKRKIGGTNKNGSRLWAIVINIVMTIAQIIRGILSELWLLERSVRAIMKAKVGRTITL
jgi:hypothetical protein